MASSTPPPYGQFDPATQSVFRKVLQSPRRFVKVSEGALTSTTTATLLSLLDKMVVAMPKCILGGGGPGETQEPFLPWLERRMLFLWASEAVAKNSEQLSSRCLRVQRAVLDALQMRETDAFRRTLDGILGVVGDIEDQLQNEEAEEVRVGPFPRKEGAYPEKEEEEEDLSIVFTSASDAESFQSTLLRLVAEFGDGLVKYCSSELHLRHWTTLCKILEGGDAMLKLAAVNLCSEIIKQGGAPRESKACLRLYDCLFAMVSFLSEADTSEEELGEDVGQFLSDSLASCLQEMLLVLKDCSDNLVQKRLFCGEVVACVSDLNAGKGKPLEGELLATVLDCLCLAIDEGVVSPSFDLTFLFTLLKDHSEDAVGCLAALVVSEATPNLKKGTGAVQRSESRRQQRRSLTQSCPLLQMSDLSPTWNRIHQDLNSQMSDRETSVQQLQAVTQVAKRALSRLIQNCHPTPVHISFIPKELVGEILQVFIENLIAQPSDSAAFGQFCQVMCNALFFQPMETLTQSLLQMIVAMATMPWMSGEVRLMDLRISETLAHNMIKGSDALRSGLDSNELLRNAVELLSLPSKEVSSKWRSKVITKMLSEENPDVNRALIEHMPIWMQTLGQGCHPLAHQVIQACLASGDRNLTLALAKKAGILVCLFSKSTVLHKKGGNFEVVCNRCSGKKPLKVDNPEPMLDSDEVSDLLKLVGHDDSEVKQAILSLLRPMANHIGFKETTVGLWIKYIEEMEESPTMQFAEGISNLLTPPAAEVSCPEMVAHLPGWDSQHRVCIVVMDALEEMSSKAMISLSVPFLDTVSRVLVRAGSCGVAFLEERCVHLLVDLLLSKCCHIAAFYHAGEFLRTNLVKYKSATMEKLAKKLIETGGTTQEPINAIKIVTKIMDTKKFLQKHAKYLLPQLVLWCAKEEKGSKEATAPLELVATLTGQRLRYLLAENFMYIYPHIIIHTKDTVTYNQAVSFLETETKLSLQQLLPSHRQKVTTELLLRFHSHEKRVYTAFQWFAKDDPDFKGKKVRTKAELAFYVMPKFLGVLGYFDQQLLNKLVPERDKLEILRALLAIFKFMSSHKNGLSVVKHKILGTLRTAAAAKIPAALSLLGELWNEFVRSMDMASVGSVLTQIAAGLWGMYEQGVPQALELYKFLILKEHSDLVGRLPQLNFLPEDPDLAEINECIRRASGLTSTPHFKDVLDVVVPSLKNENVEVKLLALRKLKQLLKMNQRNLQGLIVASDVVDPIVGSLVERLIVCARDNDEGVVAAAGRCLGFIGAVDPGRLERLSDLSGSFDISFSLFEENFVHSLLKTLANAFLTATESADANACEFSLQEVLRAYQIQGDASLKSLQGKVWNMCSDSTREVLNPFLTSCYSCAPEKYSYKTPIFKSELSYADWLSCWCCHLINKVRDEKAQRVLVGCKATLRKDVKTAQFLIPHIILEVLCQDDENDTYEIEKEIYTVIAAGEQQEAQNNAVLQRASSGSAAQSAAELYRLASQSIFSILDHMNRWLRKKYIAVAQGMKKTDQEKVKSKDRGYLIIDKFVNSIQRNTLAKASFRCGAYARSLMHWEGHLRQHPADLQHTLDTLQHVYGALQEQDFVVGAAAIRMKEPSLKVLIKQYESLGNFNDALACYESVGKNSELRSSEEREEDFDDNWQSGVVRCYLECDQPHTASIMVRGIAETKPELAQQLRKYQLEAAWQLGQWDMIDQGASLDEDSGADWETGLAVLLKCLHTEDRKSFMRHLESVTGSLMRPISAAALEEGAFERAYGHVVKLQVLNEMETFAESAIFGKNSLDPSNESLKSLTELLSSWMTRASYAQYSASHLEAVLKVRRTVLDVALKRGNSQGSLPDLLRKSLGEVLLLSSKVARKSGQLQKAYNILLDCGRFNPPELYREKAKVYWARDSPQEAILALRKGIKAQFPWCTQNMDKKAVRLADSKFPGQVTRCASAKLQLARYIDESANLEADSVPSFYIEARTLNSGCEDGYYFLGRFYDKVIGKNYKAEELDCRGDMVSAIVQQYARSVLAGCQHILHSLPRMLSLWFDYGSRVVAKAKELAAKEKKKLPAELAQDKKSHNDMCLHLNKINDMIARFLSMCPPYYILMVFPQLTSRICHGHDKVWEHLRASLVDCFQKFPERCFWHMVSLSKSSYKLRVDRCAEVFKLASQKGGEALKKMLNDGERLAEQLKNLSEIKLDYSARQLSESAPLLYKSRKTYGSIMIPSTRNLSLVLPSPNGDTRAHNPFQDATVYVASLEESLTVMRSLVAPKKITFRGSNGNPYSFLCKPKDDLRRDCRLIDFNNLLNKLFMKDPECRKRDLKIRTYKVVPLNESSGLIEWIDNLTPLRMILVKLYREQGVQPLSEREQVEFETLLDDPEGNRTRFDRLMRKHPPVFAEWFVRNFPDPQTWFMARLAYVRTTAVMSMVGYLHGLGDRHAENILFDSTNGETVHVDLNCLFNKGDDLKIPEVVPFRLTHNMVTAMGPTGVEGPFHAACRASLGLMRSQQDVLMTALRPFYFDPLVDWVAGGKQRQKQGESSEIVNAKAVETLRQINERLDGLVSAATTAKRRALTASSRNKTKIDMPLSVVGQVNFLIKEATAVENLSQMYHGWTPHY